MYFYECLCLLSSSLLLKLCVFWVLEVQFFFTDQTAGNLVGPSRDTKWRQWQKESSSCSFSLSCLLPVLFFPLLPRALWTVRVPLSPRTLSVTLNSLQRTGLVIWCLVSLPTSWSLSPMLVPGPSLGWGSRTTTGGQTVFMVGLSLEGNGHRASHGPTFQHLLVRN